MSTQKTVPKVYRSISHSSQKPKTTQISISCCCVRHSVMSDSLWLYGLQPTRLLCPWDSPGKNTGMGCHFLLQGIFLPQGSNLHLLHLLHHRCVLYTNSATWEQCLETIQIFQILKRLIKTRWCKKKIFIAKLLMANTRKGSVDNSRTCLEVVLYKMLLTKNVTALRMYLLFLERGYLPLLFIKQSVMTLFFFALHTT